MGPNRTALPLRLVLLTVLALASLSCEEKDFGRIEVPQRELPSRSGQMFVTVRTAGSWTLYVEYPEGNDGWLSISPSSGTGSKSSIVLSYSANDSSSVRYADIVAVFGEYETRLTLLQAGTRPDGPDDPDDPDPDPDDPDYPGLVSDKVRRWMELPRVEHRSGFAWVFHNMTSSASGTRNYSLYYDADNRIARWVAYPLNRDLIGSGSRTNRWGKDPKIPYEYQSDVSGGFGSGYDRGHQLPSADRLSREANIMTFYSTNMTPQLSGLNQRIWADLEGKVRKWAESSDTLYVVTGCIPGSNFITDCSGNRVNVPSMYFKALLRYDPGSTIGPYMAMAICLEHRTYSESSVNSSMTMTVDELEQLTGFDFFCNLPEDIQAKVESEQLSSWWGL